MREPRIGIGNKRVSPDERPEKLDMRFESHCHLPLACASEVTALYCDLKCRLTMNSMRAAYRLGRGRALPSCTANR